MNNDNNDFEQRIKILNEKFDKLVSLVDEKPDFYNNIFFDANSKPVLNLINTDYISKNNIKEDFSINSHYIIDHNDIINSKYLLKNPFYKFSLPSSDDSENEENIETRESSFKSICNKIIDTDVLKIIDVDNIDKKEGEKIKDILKRIYPILMFRSIPELSSINDILKIFTNKIHIKPYEIKRTFLPPLNTYIFLVKLYSLDDATKARYFLSKEFDVNFHICYDRRELKESKWFCVIFRRECNKDKNNYLFKDIINDIFEKIDCKEKKIISFNIDNNIFVKSGKVFYSAIKVDNLNEALNLCLKYNNYNNLKVHLHNLTYQNSKKNLPRVLIQKNFNKKNNKVSDKGNELYNKLFGDLKKNKKYKNDY